MLLNQRSKAEQAHRYDVTVFPVDNADYASHVYARLCNGAQRSRQRRARLNHSIYM